MRFSKLFTKTQKTYPKDEISISSQLFIRGGFVDKVAAGIYTLLPLGLRVATKISQIIREEMEETGAQEVYMPGLIPKANWEESGRWENFDALFKLKGVDEREYGLGATHEEIVTPLANKFVLSYKDLPFGIFQIQNKFRNEVRAKSGVLRTREFLMKDLYSFHVNEEDLDEYYEKLKNVYWKIFERVGIKDSTYLVYASGGTFAKYSHEFQTETEAGEDEIYVCNKCKIGLNKEILEGEFKCPECEGSEYEIKKCVEVGNIFKLRTKFSEPFKLHYKDEKDQEKPVEMGCYGIGIQRLMGTVAEVYHDQKGLIWPESVSPYKVHLVGLNLENSEVSEEAEKVYKELINQKIEVLFDDRKEVNAGVKLNDADLIGCTYRLIVSEKTLAKNKIEFKARNESESVDLTLDEFTQKS